MAWTEETKGTITYTEEDKSIGSTEMTFLVLAEITFLYLAETTFAEWVTYLYVTFTEETKGTISPTEETKGTISPTEETKGTISWTEE